MKNNFVVIWIPDSFYIFLESKKNYLKQVRFGVYRNKLIETKEFDNFEDADRFTNKLWEM